ncbi:DUF1611 domain-containing protein [Brevibacterium daeguense]|uniref:DUF1611 domain-containing protein n=1 Tax=Brevibacterium daeguense TaxID=909936 RepID=A0ABP8ELD3_9MICO|nr:DUF1611 domain-containing protein [Brevibacterium daeguense]
MEQVSDTLQIPALPHTPSALNPIAAVDEQVRLEALAPARLRRAKFSYTTRRAAQLAHDGQAGLYLLSGDSVRPLPGDILLARVVTLGKHKRIETPTSRRAGLFAGDEVVLAYGNRYAADQFHAVVPDGLGPCSMVAAGGVAGLVIDQHAAVEDATVIEPLGLLSTKTQRLTMAGLADLSVDIVDESTPGRPPVIAVFGTSMNSGKSTTAAQLIHGLTAAGRQVGAVKVTGTGAGNDPGQFRDAGAAAVLDFTDFGYPTTFKLDYPFIKALLTAQIRALTSADSEVIVLEIADGLYQAETRRLLEDPVFAAAVDTVVFAATDALGAVAGVDFLTARGVDVACVSGVLTASPLAAAEARAALDVPVAPTFELAQPELALQITGLAGRSEDR